MYVRNFIIFLFFLLISTVSYGQTISYSYVDPCTGTTKTISVPSNGVTVTYYGQIRTFAPTDFYSGAFETWAQGVFSSFGNNNPCASVVGMPAAVSVAQSSAINFLGIVNSLSSLADMATGTSNMLGGSIGSVQTSTTGNGNSGNGSKGGNKNNQSNGNNSNNNVSGGSSNAGGTGNNTTSTGSNGSQGSQSGSQGSQGSGTTGSSTSQGSQGSGTTGSSTSQGSQGSGTTGSSTSQGGGSGSTNTGSSQNSGNPSSSGNGSGTGNGSSQGNSQQTETTGSESEGKTNLVGSSVNSIGSSSGDGGGSSSGGNNKAAGASAKNGNRPSILASSDFVGFNFKNSDVTYGGKVTGGLTSLRWDGKRSWGVNADYTSAIKGPNITGFYAFMNPKRIDLISTSVTIGFEAKPTLYATLALGQMWTVRKNLKAVYMLTASSGQVYGEPFIGTAVIAGSMYDFNITKRFAFKTMLLYVYAPYVSYYNDILLKSPHVVLPIIGTNIGITKRFKININAGGAWAIKDAALNYTVMMGTRMLL